MPADDVHVHVHVHVDADDRLEEILRIVRNIDEKGTRMSKELDDLTAAVERAETVQDSAIELIQGLADRISSAGTDPEKLKELTDALDRQARELADAITTGTAAEGLATQSKDDVTLDELSFNEAGDVPAPGAAGSAAEGDVPPQGATAAESVAPGGGGLAPSDEPVGTADEPVVLPGTKVPLSEEEQAAAGGNTEQTPTA